MIWSSDAPQWRDQTYTIHLGWGSVLGSLADVSGWLAARMWCLRASSSASPGSVWGVRAPADIHSRIGWLWWDGSVQQIVRVMQHLSSIYQEISGRALKLCLLWWFVLALLQTSCVNMRNKSSHLYRKGLTCFQEGSVHLGAVPITAGSRYMMVNCRFRPSPLPAAVGLL